MIKKTVIYGDKNPLSSMVTDNHSQIGMTENHGHLGWPNKLLSFYGDKKLLVSKVTKSHC